MPVAIELAPVHLKVLTTNRKNCTSQLTLFCSVGTDELRKNSLPWNRHIIFYLTCGYHKQISTKTVDVNLVHSCREIATFDKRTHLHDI